MPSIDMEDYTRRLAAHEDADELAVWLGSCDAGPERPSTRRIVLGHDPNARCPYCSGGALHVSEGLHRPDGTQPAT